MKEKILLASLIKIFDLASKEFVCPSASNLENLSREELSSLYEDTWSLICNIHNIAFEAKQANDLLITLDL